MNATYSPAVMTNGSKEKAVNIISTRVLKPMREYSSFSIDSANRDVKENHIERIAESVEEMYMLDLYPIVATSDRSIMDGQHRFGSARGLNVPFYTIFGDDIRIADIAEANANTKRYDEHDALAVYNKLGMTPYQYVQLFMDKNPRAGIVGKVRRWLNQRSVRADFIDGRFSVHTPNYAQKVADCIADFDAVVGKYSPKYQDILANLVLNPMYDHKRMIERLSQIPSRLKPFGTLEEGMEIINHIYNYNKARNNVVELKIVTRDQQVWRFDSDKDVIPSLYDSPARGIDYSRNVEVHCADDLDVFSQHPSARPISGARTEKLVEFMGRRNLLQFFPIIVDRNLVIYDGQRRWMAAKRLGLPIHYIVANNISIWMTALTGGRSESWGLRDYLKHYCQMGREEYWIVQDIESRYEWVGLDFVVMSLSDVHHNAVSRNLFMSGRLQIMRRWETNELMKALNSLDDGYLKRDASIQKAFWRLQDDGYDIKQIAAKLNMYRDRLGSFYDADSCVAALIELGKHQSKQDVARVVVQ